MKNEMIKNAYYPVMFDYSGDVVKKVVNSSAPYYSVEEALRHAYEADYPRNAEPGYAYWNGSKWVSQSFDDYEESKSEDPDYRTRQDILHSEANYRLDCEMYGW